MINKGKKPDFGGGVGDDESAMGSTSTFFVLRIIRYLNDWHIPDLTSKVELTGF